MNTKIVKISKDQNEITHESGVITVFQKQEMNLFCQGCVYSNYDDCRLQIDLCTSAKRKDEENGIFKLKQ